MMRADEEAIAALVEDAPPLTEDQRTTIAEAFARACFEGGGRP